MDVATNQQASKTRRKILLLFKDADVLALLISYFRRKDCEALAAVTLDDAFEWLQKEKIDIVLSDFHFCSNRHDVQIQIKTLAPDAKVIITNERMNLHDFDL